LAVAFQGRRCGQEQARLVFRPEDAKRLQAQSDDGAAGRRLPPKNLLDLLR
jgi:hypothetical protein